MGAVGAHAFATKGLAWEISLYPTMEGKATTKTIHRQPQGTLLSDIPIVQFHSRHSHPRPTFQVSCSTQDFRS